MKTFHFWICFWIDCHPLARDGLADKEPTTKLPVMFYIHGGGYKFDSSNDKLFGPDFLIDENVILVSFLSVNSLKIKYRNLTV